MKKKTLGAYQTAALFSAAATFFVACEDAEGGAASDGGAAETTEDDSSGDDSTSDDASENATSSVEGTSDDSNSDAPSDDSASTLDSSSEATEDATDSANTSMSSDNSDGSEGISGSDTASDFDSELSSTVDSDTLPDPVNPDGGPAEETSRLRPRYTVLEDGSRVFETFVDTELGKDCRFMDTSNGAGPASYHCIAPVFTSLVYLDADCTQPAINLSSRGCGELLPDSLVAVNFPSEVPNCAGPQHLLTMGEPVQVDTVYSSQVAGNCGPRDATNLELYAATEPDFSQYVEGSLRTEELADGLELQHMDSAEGDTQIWSFGVDGEVCAPTALNNDSSAERCLPSSVTAVKNRYFSEDTCSGQELMAFGATTCAAPSSRTMVVRAEQTPDGCGQTSEVRAISALETPNPMTYEGSSEACFSYEPSFVAEWYALGATIDAATFPALVSAELGDGRLRARVRTSAAGDVLNLIEWFDTELDTQCDAVAFTDGTTRCFSGSIGAYEAYYSDAECTEPVYVAQESGCFTFPERPLMIKRDTGSSCYTIDRVFELDSYAGPLYELVDGCQPAAALPEGDAVFVQGNEVQVTDFPELVRVEEP